MKNYLEFEVKYDYDPEIESPSRIFIAFAETLESFKSIDGLLAKSISKEIVTKQFLSSLNTGSIISTIKHFFEEDDYQTLGTADLDQKQIGQFMTEGRAEIVRSFEREKKINSANTVKELNKKITEIAQKTGIEKSVSYREPEIVETAEVLSKVANSTKTLTMNEKIEYSTDGKKTELRKNISVDLEKIKEEITENIFETTEDMRLIIKKPDLLGTSKWIFKNGKNTIDAKVNDMEWLSHFHERKFKLACGDTVNAKVKLIKKYDKYRNLIDVVYEIIKIKSIDESKIEYYPLEEDEN
jgi:hypothetical protein